MLNGPRGPSAGRWSIILAAVACCLAVAPAYTQKLPAPVRLPAPAPQERATLQILWDQELLSDPSPAMDVRWASERTVYVAWLRHGVAQLALDGKFTALRRLFPDANADTFEYLPFDVMAASQEYVVAASRWNQLSFSTAQPGSASLIHKHPVSLSQAVDLSGHRLLLLGSPFPLGRTSFRFVGASYWKETS